MQAFSFILAAVGLFRVWLSTDTSVQLSGIADILMAIWIVIVLVDIDIKEFWR